MKNITVLTEYPEFNTVFGFDKSIGEAVIIFNNKDVYPVATPGFEVYLTVPPVQHPDTNPIVKLLGLGQKVEIYILIFRVFDDEVFRTETYDEGKFQQYAGTLSGSGKKMLIEKEYQIDRIEREGQAKLREIRNRSY